MLYKRFLCVRFIDNYIRYNKNILEIVVTYLSEFNNYLIALIFVHVSLYLNLLNT